MSKLFQHQPHPHIEVRKAHAPVTVAEQLPSQSAMARFNSWLALKITAGVGTMWCAYIFAIIALISLPSALASGNVITIISWIAQTFLQLVLLSIIIVGQNILSAASDIRAEATYKDADAILHESEEIQAHLEAQDLAIEKILQQLLTLQTAMNIEATGRPGQDATDGRPGPVEGGPVEGGPVEGGPVEDGPGNGAPGTE